MSALSNSINFLRIGKGENSGCIEQLGYVTGYRKTEYRSEERRVGKECRSRGGGGVIGDRCETPCRQTLHATSTSLIGQFSVK